MKTVHFYAVVFCAALTLGSGLAAQTRGVTAEDYLSFEFLSDPHFSPAGEPQPDAHGRAEASRREHQEAGLLVRQVSQRE
jgi:hypothetical protein